MSDPTLSKITVTLSSRYGDDPFELTDLGIEVQIIDGALLIFSVGDEGRLTLRKLFAQGVWIEGSVKTL